MGEAPRVSRAKNKEMTDDSDSIIRMLHEATVHGNKKKLEKILKSGVNVVDCRNSLGQTPLFLACFEGQRRLAKLLLKHGANPNARCLEGSTPVHAASFTADVKLFGHLLDAGGDLRLHDNVGLSPRDWAARQPNVKRRKSFLDFIDEIRAMANYSYGMAPSNATCARNPAFQKFKKRQSYFQRKLSPLFQNFGFGLVHEGNFGYDHAVRGFIPVIPESHLKHDNAGPTYNNGQFMVMESMLWKNVPVTVKRLHRTLPAEEASVDLLIEELEYVSCLQHPNILLLLAACQNNSMEGMVLLYEKVRCGSLDAHLYQRGQTLEEKDVYKIFYQISNGLVYLHQRGVVHGCITSHAIQLVLPNYAKLSNFEYARPRVSRNGPHGFKLLPKYAYNWMAPELLSAQQNVMEESDIYSLTAILWEVLSGTPPWVGRQPDDIVMELVTNKNSLPLDNIQSPFNDLLVRGLSFDPAERITDIAFRDLMWQGLRTNASDPQIDNNDRHSSPGGTNVVALGLSSSSMYNGAPSGFAVYHTSGGQATDKTSDNERLAEENYAEDQQDPQSLKKTGSLRGPAMDTRRLEQMMDRLVDLERSERPNQSLKAPHPSPDEQFATEESDDEDVTCENADVDEPDQWSVDPGRRRADSKMGKFAVKRTPDELRNLECEGDAWKDVDRKGRKRSGGMTRDEFVYSIHKLEMEKGLALSQSGGDGGPDVEVGERSNPFLDKELKKQSEEICRQLLSRPIPKLFAPQTLITGRCDGESIQRPTVYGTILREYSQSRQTLVSKRRGICPPTFGISLTELKAAIMPRASLGGQGAFNHRREMNTALQPGLNISSSYQSSSKNNLNGEIRACTFKPASHREPSLNISPSKRSACPMQNFAIPPPASAGGISSASYIVQQAESLGGEGGAGFRQTYPRRTSYNIMSLASYDHPDRNDSDADMIRFKSDPLLQRKIYLREFAKGQTRQPAMPTHLGPAPFAGAESLEDLEEDDNLEELIGKSWDRPQQGGSLPPKYSWWNDPSVGWTGSSQNRFKVDKAKKYLIKEEVSERQWNTDGRQRCMVREEEAQVQRNQYGTHVQRNQDDTQIQSYQYSTQVQRNQDGTQVQRNQDGAQVQSYQYRTQVQRNQDGTQVQRNQDDTQIQRNPDGAQVQRNQDGAQVQSYQYRTQVQRNQDGTQVQGNQDDTQIQRNQDGAQVQRNQDGAQVQIYQYSTQVQRNQDGTMRYIVLKEEDLERQRSRDGCQRHAIEEEDLRKERNREQDKRPPIKEGDSLRGTKSDKDRNKHGDAEQDKAEENTRCHFCEQELSALTPKSSQLSRTDAVTKLSLKSTTGRTDSKADTKVHEENPLIGGGKQRTDWPVGPSSAKQRTTDGNATDLEDYYFDDDLHSSSLYKEKYMRLQSTMAMDTNSMSTPHALSSFTSPIYSSQRSTAAVASSTSERERIAEIQVAGKSTQGSASATKSSDVSNISRKSATCPEKWLMAAQSHNMSTITVESDSQGHHRICLKKIDPLTGTESTTYKASVVADQVITQVFLGSQDDNNDAQIQDVDDDDEGDDNEGDDNEGDDNEGDSGSSISDTEKPFPV